MVPSLEVRFDLQTGDWLVSSGAIRKLTYARWILALALVILVALGTQYVTVLAVHRNSVLIFAEHRPRLLQQLASKSVELRRVLDQDRGAQGSFRRPNGQLVEKAPIVDLK